MDPSEPSPRRIFQISSGHWATALLGAGVVHRIFTHIERGADTLESIASEAAIAPRGALALLDGLVGLGLLTRCGGHYKNTPEASRYLVEGQPESMVGWATMQLREMAGWSHLPESVRTGAPAPGHDASASDPEMFWRELVTAIVPSTLPVAQIAAARLDLASRGPVEILDMGGGSGVYSMVLLGASPEATATQADFPAVNRIARELLERAGLAERFRTLDGNFHETDLGACGFDLVIFSNIAHAEPPEGNRSLLRRARAALRPGGTVLIADYILADDRSGNPASLMFHANMLLGTPRGAVYREADYRAWLAEAGFSRVELVPTRTSTTLLFAS